MRTSLNPTRTLTENPAWPEIAVLIRFNLMLSFNNKLHIQLYLPELFHIITTLIATGPPLIRASIHGLIVNLVQSLCTVQTLDPSNLNRLNILLTELSPVARQQRLLVTHGLMDPIIPFASVRQQIQQLKDAGLRVEWHEFIKAHNIAGEHEVRIIRDFIQGGYGKSV